MKEGKRLNKISGSRKRKTVRIFGHNINLKQSLFKGLDREKEKGQFKSMTDCVMSLLSQYEKMLEGSSFAEDYVITYKDYLQRKGKDSHNKFLKKLVRSKRSLETRINAESESEKEPIDSKALIEKRTPQRKRNIDPSYLNLKDQDFMEPCPERTRLFDSELGLWFCAHHVRSKVTSRSVSWNKVKPERCKLCMQARRTEEENKRRKIEQQSRQRYRTTKRPEIFLNSKMWCSPEKPVMPYKTRDYDRLCLMKKGWVRSKKCQYCPDKDLCLEAQASGEFDDLRSSLLHDLQSA